MRRKVLFSVALFCICSTSEGWTQKAEMTHARGSQSIGFRIGKGIKNKYDVGVTYTYSFNQKSSLLVELDHEEASFGYSDFVNFLLLSPGVEYVLCNPTKWFYWNFTGGGSVGYDRWTSEIVDDEVNGFVYGANIGTGIEVMPYHWLSLTLKAQQYLLFGNDDQYMKPNFSLGTRINFH